jgi:hypothetical protein
MNCSVEGCENEAAAGGLCWACRKCRSRKGTTRRKRLVRHASRREMVLEAALHLADVDPMDGDGWERAWHRLRMAMRRYVAAGSLNNVPGGQESHP